MAVLTFGWGPNPRQKRFAPAGTAFKLLGADGNVYATLAAAVAAGTTAYTPGIKGWGLVGAASDGVSISAGTVLVHFGGVTAPSDDTTSTPMFPGTYFSGDGPCQAIWVRTLTSGDLVYAFGAS